MSFHEINVFLFVKNLTRNIVFCLEKNISETDSGFEEDEGVTSDLQSIKPSGETQITYTKPASPKRHLFEKVEAVKKIKLDINAKLSFEEVENKR